MRAIIFAALAVLLLSGCSGHYKSLTYRASVYPAGKFKYAEYDPKFTGLKVKGGRLEIKSEFFQSWTLYGANVVIEPQYGIVVAEAFNRAEHWGWWEGKQEKILQINKPAILSAVRALINNPVLANEYFLDPDNEALANQVAQLADFEAALALLERHDECKETLKVHSYLIDGDEGNVLLLKRFVNSVAAIGVDGGSSYRCTNNGAVVRYADDLSTKEVLLLSRYQRVRSRTGKFEYEEFYHKATDEHKYPFYAGKKIDILLDFRPKEAAIVAEKKREAREEKARKRAAKRREQERIQRELAPTAEEKKFGKF